MRLPANSAVLIVRRAPLGERRPIRLVAALIGSICVFAGCERSPVVTRGERFFAVSDEGLLALTLRSSTERVEAHRFHEREPFWYSFERDGGTSFERCEATPALDGARAALQTLVALEVLAPKVAKGIVTSTAADAWIDLEIRGPGIFWHEPFQLRLTSRGAPAGSLYALDPKNGDVYRLDRAVLKLFQSRCAP